MAALAFVGLILALPASSRADARTVGNGRILVETGTPDSKCLFALLPGHDPLTYDAYSRFFTAAYSPDGQRVAFAAENGLGHEIYVMNADGTGKRQLTHNSSDDESPSWSPDGKTIAFTSNRDGDYDIYVMNADGSHQVNLTNSYWSGDDLNPHWSPDGKLIAYDSTAWFNTTHVWMIPLAGGDPFKLTLGPGNAPEWFDDWSPDGSHFLVESERDSNGNWDLYQYATADALSGTPVPPALAATPYIENLGTYSPDGKKIAFSSNRGGSFQAYTMNIDGSDLHKLTNTRNEDTFVLAWQPLSDTHSPTAHAVASVVKPGVRGALSFTAGDDSGRVVAEGYVLAGKHLVGYFQDVFGVRTAGTMRSFAWRSPKTITTPLRLYVTVRDRSGNESPRSCAPLRVQSP
jgi:Tol biopolymer transport system component